MADVTPLVDGGRMVGDSVAMRRVRAIIQRLSRSLTTTLIHGDTGTGKEIVALLLHRNSRRRHQPLIPINCAAIPETLIEGELFGYEKGAFSGAQCAYPGKFRLADGGTLFLDELGELSLAAQAKILRAVESGEVFPLGARRPFRCSVRIISATSRDLVQEVTAGRFRADLYYRLAVARIDIPPLRERTEDVAPIARSLVTRLCDDMERPEPLLSAGFLLALERHDWPGNVREMRNAIEHALAVCDDERRLTAADLPDALRRAVPVLSAVRPGSPDERALLVSTLKDVGGCKAAAARQLNCSRMTLYRRLERAGLASLPWNPAS